VNEPLLAQGDTAMRGVLVLIVCSYAISHLDLNRSNRTPAADTEEYLVAEWRYKLSAVPVGAVGQSR